jgi:hypothetical protein
MGLSSAIRPRRRLAAAATAEDRLARLADVMMSYARQGVTAVSPTEVLKIIGYGGARPQLPPVMAPPDPRADPLTGCMPVSAPPAGEHTAG